MFEKLFGGDPQSQGSLAAIAQILQASGPSRTPRGLYQILGSGMVAGQEATQQAMQQAQAAQLRGLQIKGAESDLLSQQRALEKAQALSAAAKSAYRTPGAQAASMPGGPTPANAEQIGSMQSSFDTDAYINQVMAIDPAMGFQLQQSMKKAAPKFDSGITFVNGPDGKPMAVRTADDGSVKQLDGMSPREKMHFLNTGGKTLGVNEYTGEQGASFTNTASAGDVLQAKVRREGYAREDARAKAKSDASAAEPSLNDATLDFLADQALRGDTSVYQNLGRGAQGAANLVALRTRVANKANGRGLSGGDLASIGADYMGQKAALRTSGNISARVENAIAEADQLIPVALDASRNVSRSGLLPFGKAQIMFDTQTNSTALKAFATANNGLVAAYAGAMARGQKPTVSDYEHARDILAEAQSQEAYEATVQQMKLEMKAASAAPRVVREHLRSDIAGKAGNHSTIPNPVAAPAQQQKFDMLPAAKGFAGKRMRADNGTTYRSDGTKWIKE